MASTHRDSSKRQPENDRRTDTISDSRQAHQSNSERKRSSLLEERIDDERSAQQSCVRRFITIFAERNLFIRVPQGHPGKNLEFFRRFLTERLTSKTPEGRSATFGV